MKNANINPLELTLNRSGKLLLPALLAGLLTASTLSVSAWQHKDKNKNDDYAQTNLVSDVAGAAILLDTNLVNAWGISFGPTSPFWVSANGSGRSTLYMVTNDAAGVHVSKVGLEVFIPGEGTPSGQVFNSTTNFHGDAFIFSSEDGIISGWRGSLGTHAEVLATRTNGVYKGITLVTNAGPPMLLAANFAEATVDVYDSNATLVVQLSDTNAPAGYAPFNVQTIGAFVFVTYAKQNPTNHDDLKGEGHGLIDVLDPVTGNFHRLATGSDAGGKLKDINSPWGIALAPASFGAHADQLLVGNFGSGTIMTFDAAGKLHGLLEGTDENPIVIDGLWALTFGNGNKAGNPGTLYFSAGPDEEGHGLFGSLDLVPEPPQHGNGNHGHHGDDNGQGDDEHGHENDHGNHGNGGNNGNSGNHGHH
jgi:uncharacterized protein (TIGR03118 family)